MSTIDFRYDSASAQGQDSILDSYFTVYQTERAIELHAGCEDYMSYRVICTCLHYEQACEIARLSGNLHHLPVKNFIAAGNSA